MKTMYICEKCGKAFEDFDEAHRCEERHYSRANICTWEGEADMQNIGDMPLEVYEEGNEMPTETIVKFTRTIYEDNAWKTEVYYQRAKVTGKPFGNHVEE